MNINFNTIIIKILPYIIVVLIAYLLSFILYIFLPKTAPIILDDKQNSIKYTKYRVKSSFEEKVKKVVKPKKQEYSFMDNITLKAIFAMGDNKGFITILEKASKKTHTLGIGDSFKNYKLLKIYPSYVIFKKGSKEYKLSFAKQKEMYSVVSTEEEELPKTKGISVKDTNSFALTKSIIKKYSTNYDKIWKEISINEVMKDGQIDGFKIDKISSNSVFKSLGLKKGDIIKSVNNITLKSYADAFELYKTIETMDFVHIEILRNNKLVELDYEIR